MALGGGRKRKIGELLPRRFLGIVHGASPDYLAVPGLSSGKEEAARRPRRVVQTPEEMRRALRRWSGRKR